MQLGVVTLLVMAPAGMTKPPLRLPPAPASKWLKRHIYRVGGRQSDPAERAYRRVARQFEPQELPITTNEPSGGASPSAHFIRAAGAQPAASRRAAVSDRLFGALRCPTVPGNVPTGQAGGQPGTGRHRRVPAVGTLPAFPLHPAPDSAPPRVAS